MSIFTDFAANAILGFLFRGQPLGMGSTAGVGSGPPTMYLSLFTELPGDATAGTEVSGGGYARVAMTSSTSSWALNTDNHTISNLVLIAWPPPTAGWGTVVGVGVHDQATGGSLILRVALTTPRVINSGDTPPSFQPESLFLQLD